MTASRAANTAHGLARLHAGAGGKKEVRVLSPVPKRSPSRGVIARKDSPADSRMVILNASAELFSTLSYAGTGLRQIADKVGIKAASLYHHFGSKEEILEEILRIGLAAVSRSTMASVGALPSSATPRQRIEAAIEGHLRGIFDNLVYTSTNLRFHGHMPPEVEGRIQPLRASYTDYWRELLADAKRDGYLAADVNVALLRPLLLGAMNRTAAWFDKSQGPVEELVLTFLLSFDGIWAQGRLRGHESKAGASAGKPAAKATPAKAKR